jgi:DNA (cytosine-5)-methyltransferase 1
MRPVVLDLFSGGGGAGQGYRRAGFEVVGIDNVDHFTSYAGHGQFFKMDWQRGLEQFAHRVDFIHASPPCQRWSGMTHSRPGNSSHFPDLIEPVRQALKEYDLPYIIENVEHSPLHNPIMLCGWMFGYETYRHRFFESSMPLIPPPHYDHTVHASRAGHYEAGTFISVAGHCAPIALAREVMDVTVMPRPELAEAIPPYFTHYLGLQVASQLMLETRAPGPEASRLVWSNVE